MSEKELLDWACKNPEITMTHIRANWDTCGAGCIQMILTLLKRFWSCRVRGAHVFGKPLDCPDGLDIDPHSYKLPPGRYKTCRYCPTVRAVRRRKGKG